MKKLRIVAILLTLLWMGLIFHFSSETGMESHEVSSGVTLLFCRTVQWLTGKNVLASLSPHQYAMLEAGFRKLAHMSVYMMLSFHAMLVMFTFPFPMVFRMVASLAFCVIYAITDEFHQMLVDGRSPQAFDVFIDSVGSVGGIILALLFFCVVYTIWHMHRERKREIERTTVRM